MLFNLQDSLRRGGHSRLCLQTRKVCTGSESGRWSVSAGRLIPGPSSHQSACQINLSVQPGRLMEGFQEERRVCSTGGSGRCLCKGMRKGEGSDWRVLESAGSIITCCSICFGDLKCDHIVSSNEGHTALLVGQTILKSASPLSQSHT